MSQELRQIYSEKDYSSNHKMNLISIHRFGTNVPIMRLIFTQIYNFLCTNILVKNIIFNNNERIEEY